MKRVLCLLTLIAVMLTASAQSTQDFASKFMSIHAKDSTISCVTVSPKMMESLLVQQEEEGNDDGIMQAIAKLKSMRIVTADGNYYEQAEELLKKNARRFEQRHDYEGEGVRGAIYTRKNRKGENVELILLNEDNRKGKLTIVNLTGDIDEEFLCFLYNNKSFKD